MTKPFFSIIIPLYNKQNFIADTLKSVIAQTYTNFEVIIIDDKSTDNSIEAALTVTDDRVRIIEHNVNKGLSASRNTGIINAKGKLIAFLDADDTWQPLFLEKIYDLTQNYPNADLFAAKYKEVYRNTTIEHNINTSTGILDNFFLLNLKQPIYCPSGLCIKREIFDKIGYYNESITLGEDVDFNIRIHLSYKMAFCNEPLVNYTMESENQITRSSLSNKTITDFDKYEILTDSNPYLKKFLDLNRYIMAKAYRLEGNTMSYKKMIRGISLNSLNYKQIALLYAPVFILKIIKRFKMVLLKKGLNPTTY